MLYGRERGADAEPHARMKAGVHGQADVEGDRASCVAVGSSGGQPDSGVRKCWPPSCVWTVSVVKCHPPATGASTLDGRRVQGRSASIAGLAVVLAMPVV